LSSVETVSTAFRRCARFRQCRLDATNWLAELAIRFGVILRKVWGGSRTWAGARAQSVLMSVWTHKPRHSNGTSNYALLADTIG
jgi:hypothetical protein